MISYVAMMKLDEDARKSETYMESGRCISLQCMIDHPHMILSNKCVFGGVRSDHSRKIFDHVN
jgi:hypothetical protein